MMRSLWLGLLCLHGLSGLAQAQCVQAPALGLYQAPPAAAASATEGGPSASSDSATGSVSQDRVGRVVAPVSINDQGPFRFIVDTGANRSVLSRELATHLALAADGVGEVHSVHGVSTAPLVSVRSLRYRDLFLSNTPMPVLESAVLAGEQGLLGADGMAGRRLQIDFDRGCIEITASRGARALSGWEIIHGDLRFGSLLVIRASIRGLRVNLMLDTGADSSLANQALASALNARIRRDPGRVDFAVARNQDLPVVLENVMTVPSISIGGGVVELHDLTAYVGDFHIFQLWNLTSEPTLLLGMDVLSQTRGIAIDYERRTVALRLRGQPTTGTHLQDARAMFMSSIGVRR